MVVSLFLAAIIATVLFYLVAIVLVFVHLGIFLAIGLWATIGLIAWVPIAALTFGDEL